MQNETFEIQRQFLDDVSSIWMLWYVVDNTHLFCMKFEESRFINRQGVLKIPHQLKKKFIIHEKAFGNNFSVHFLHFHKFLNLIKLKLFIGLEISCRGLRTLWYDSWNLEDFYWWNQMITSKCVFLKYRISSVTYFIKRLSSYNVLTLVCLGR